MKVFEKDESSWHSKVNFVDKNDVFVGYDLGQCCCEDAGYFFSTEVTPYNWDDNKLGNANDYDFQDYVFDVDFFEEVESRDLDAGGQVVFKLIAESKPDLYLHLYNCHNGYYSHGFEVKHCGEIVKKGNL